MKPIFNGVKLDEDIGKVVGRRTKPMNDLSLR
jgi:hypothetical protein